MNTRRTIISLAAAALVAACSNITDIERSQKDTGPLRLVDVNVDVSELNVTTEGRAIRRTTAQVQEDLRKAITAEAEKRSVPTGLPANINVKVQKIYLAPLSSRVLAGTSFIESEASVTDAESGAFIVAPVDVKATGEQLRGPGPIGLAGAAATGSAESDYLAAIDAYARALLASLDASS